MFKRPELFSRVKDDGRADAALIVLWLARGGGKEVTNEEKLDRILIGQARLETKVEAIEIAIRENEHQVNVRLEVLETWRVGNGVVGIDRLEQSDKRSGAWLKALVGLILTIIGAIIIAGLKLFVFGV